MTPVQRQPVLQRRGAALLSVAGHCAIVGLMAYLGVHTYSGPHESPLIIAELVTRVAPDAPPAAADDSAATEPVESIEIPTEEPAAPPPSPVEEATVAPAPPPVAPRPEPQPSERFVEPPTEPAPVEQVADLPEPAAEPAVEPAVEPAPAGEPAPTGIAPEAAEPAAPRRALASHEERAIRGRLESWTGTFAPEDTSATIDWRDSGQEYTAVLRRVPAADAMGMEQLLVELSTERDGERLVAELRMNRVAFSNFAQFIDRWDPEVQIHDDLIDGRFHSNTEIRVSRDRGVQPIFTGKVTVAGGDIRTEGVGLLNRRTMFPAGLETRVRRIVLPPRAQTFDDSALPAERVQRLAHDSLITFHADGTFEAQPLGAGPAASGGPLGDEPFYLLANEDVALHVRGTVNGKVLVYSPERIVVAGNLRYADDPRAPGAGDYLGLVAERTVEVAEPQITGPGDLELHASIYARSRFAVRSYRSQRSGTLAIYGSVAAGSLSATEPRYATRIEFDDRLTTMRAPGFPLSDRYELDSMSGDWRVVATTP